jgi:hypothetical protein
MSGFVFAMFVLPAGIILLAVALAFFTRPRSR